MDIAATLFLKIINFGRPCTNIKARTYTESNENHQGVLYTIPFQNYKMNKANIIFTFAIRMASNTFHEIEENGSVLILDGTIAKVKMKYNI